MRPQGFANSKLTKTMEKTDIGLIGLAVMGENLALNMESKGFSVSVYNRTAPGEKGVVDRFVAGRGNGKRFTGTHSIRELVGSVRRPRRIMMMVRAGEAVDELIAQLTPLMEPGDVIIDGGNSAFQDTARRVKEVENRGLYFVGAGISGGEEGALHGPSIMPGGDEGAWPCVKKYLQTIAAQVDGVPCCDWVGPEGSGHYVKMVHNGIEYAEMQIIAETYSILKNCNRLDNDSISEIFANWNLGDLKGYLTEITAKVLMAKDSQGAYIVDDILDVAAQKGTGKWTVMSALDEGVPLGIITGAVYARFMSSDVDSRAQASEIYSEDLGDAESHAINVELLREAMFAAKLLAYAQGFSLMRAASEKYGWNLDFAGIAKIWRNGCIIRSDFLNNIALAYENGSPRNMIFAPYFQSRVKLLVPSLRRACAFCALEGVPAPCLSSALSYFDSLRQISSPANLVQGLRDFFGAHTYERVDKPRGEFFHTDWEAAAAEGAKISAREKPEGAVWKIRQVRYW